MKRKYSSPELDIRKYDFPSESNAIFTTSPPVVTDPDLNDGEHYDPFH